jgi:hypothetical protein
MTDADPDLTNLPRFLEHLEQRDAAAAQFGRQLIDAGGIIRVFWGPEQMDVWELLVQRGRMIVRFGVERGYSDGVLIARAGTPASWNNLRPIQLAAVAWARTNDIPFFLDDPDNIGRGAAAPSAASCADCRRVVSALWPWSISAWQRTP